MTYYLLQNLIEISVSDTYIWKDTLFINGGLAEISEHSSFGCQNKIVIEKISALNLSNVRCIGDRVYIGENTYVDEQYGVRLERISQNEIHLKVTQECNEWLVITIELLLLSQNMTLLHAAAIEKDGEVLLLPSWGGVGKTATVCRFIQNYGWKLLGDDLIIIKDNQAIPFLKPFVIYPYHRNLFPQLFTAYSDKHIVKNLKINALMSKAIPTVKRLTRPFPRILAFLRKHNPQSMRVFPQDLFTTEQLSEGGSIKKIVWIERCVDSKILFRKSNASEMASKSCMVSSVEIFADHLNSIFHMGGCGLFSYDETIGKMQNLIYSLSNCVECAVLEIPIDISIEKIGNIVHDTVTN